MRRTVYLKLLERGDGGHIFPTKYGLQENQERMRMAMENHVVDGLTMNSGDRCTSSYGIICESPVPVMSV